MTLDESVHGMRLRVIERAQVQGNVSAVCRELGISRTVFYRWRNRLERYGVDGVHPRRQRAQAGRPVATAPEVERLPRAREDCSKLRRRVADFRRIKPHRHDSISVWQRLFKSLHGGLRAEMPQKAEDQAAGDRTVAQSRRNAFDHGGERDPPPGVRLRVEEDLGVADVVGGRPS